MRLSLANCFLGGLGIEALALATGGRGNDVDEAAVVDYALFGAALESLLSSLLLGHFGRLVLDLAGTRERPMDLPHFPIIRTPPLVCLPNAVCFALRSTGITPHILTSLLCGAKPTLAKAKTLQNRLLRLVIYLTSACCALASPVFYCVSAYLIPLLERLIRHSLCTSLRTVSKPTSHIFATTRTRTRTNPSAFLPNKAKS